MPWTCGKVLVPRHISLYCPVKLSLKTWSSHILLKNNQTLDNKQL